MPLDWGGKLLDLFFAGLPAILKVLPPHWKSKAVARLQDLNPFARIPISGDLSRAMRLAWIEATLEVESVVLRMTAQPEWTASGTDVDRFSAHLKTQLGQLRSEALNRSVHSECVAIDNHLDETLAQIPTYVRAGDIDVTRPSLALASSFIRTLSALTGWSEREVPDLYQRLAIEGLPVEGRASNRDFDELFFSAFAEIIQSPTRYPEAGAAFGIAMGDVARTLAQTTLLAIEGIDQKMDSILLELQSLPNQNQSLTAYLGSIDALWDKRWNALSNQVARVEGKLDECAAAANRQHQETQALLSQVIAAVAGKDQLGAQTNQLARATLFALAQQLRPNELLDFDRAVAELEYAVRVYREVLAQGKHRPDRADHLVDDVMQRVAHLTAAGCLEEGASSIDKALAELINHEAEQRELQRQRRATLLEASARQGFLLRDVGRVVCAVVAIGAISDPARPAWSDEFKGRLQTFYEDGHDKGVNLSLEIAISLAKLQAAAALTTEEKGEALVFLGVTLQTLGNRENGTARLEESAQAYRAALLEHTKERDPIYWAMTQSNLGNVLCSMGERDRGVEKLKEAVHAHSVALLEMTRTYFPMDWARAQVNLGNALSILGERDTGIVQLQAAEKAYRAALDEFPREREPLEWASTQNNLGKVLLRIGERESGRTHLEAAEQALRAALEVRTQQRVPLHWALTQNNLGNVLLTLGLRESGTLRLEQAELAYRAGLEERTRGRVPLEWATTQSNLGYLLQVLAMRESEGSSVRLSNAVLACREALEERTRDLVPLDWASTQIILGDALQAVSELGVGTTHLEEALQAYSAAIEEFNEERWPEQFSAISEKMLAVQQRINSRRCEE